MASNNVLNIVLNIVTWTYFLYLHFDSVFRFSMAFDITARRSFKRCYHGNAYLAVFNLSLDQCMLECKIRSACDVIQYWHKRRECEMLTSGANSDVIISRGICSAAASCVRVGRQEMTSSSELFDQCAQCPGNTVCDLEQGTCTSKECMRLRVPNGTIKGNVLSVGANIFVRCEVGFIVENVSTRVHCLDNGTWSSAPFCVQNISHVESCQVPVALVTGEHGVPDDAITASSEWNTDYTAAQGRLDNTGAWAACSRKGGDYWQVVFPSPRTIVGITSQGYFDDEDEWVETFTVSYSADVWDVNCSSLVPAQDVNGNVKFVGNIDKHSHVNNTFHEAVFTRRVRVYPLNWQEWPTMRIELWGCPSPWP